ncbi:MAG TPA: hypothetical protein DCE78_02335 [Bacteroidetes bacterium]|nr:hypothetical protein [Bacteroidota bacterium]
MIQPVSIKPFKVQLTNKDLRWWLNFCEETKSTNMKELQANLKLYNAEYVYEIPSGNSFIEFDDERYYSMFILRFS